MNDELSVTIKNLSCEPGIYQMINHDGEVLYVGKAKNLKKRVASYFNKTSQNNKTNLLIRQVNDVKITLTRSETEALLLEANLIKQLKPKYNILLRDDKTYPYIMVGTEHDFPRIDVIRTKKKPKKGKFFGPYPSAGAVKETLNLLQKIFKIRNCRDSYYNSRSRPCLQYQIKRCSAPCVAYINNEKYRQSVNDALRFLQGRCLSIIEDFEARMDKAAAQRDFEQAAQLRDQIQNLRKIQESQAISQGDGDADVIALAFNAGVGCIQHLTIRSGQVIANQSWFPILPNLDVSLDELLQAMLHAFIAHHYLDNKEKIPGKIIVNIKTDEQSMLEAALSDLSGKQCHLKLKVRAIELKWLQMAQSNLHISIANKIQTIGTIKSRFLALAKLLGFSEIPTRMECFDISHTMGEATVASCVVFDEQGPLKSEYRRFNIDNITKGDDYAAMKQVVTRRFKRLKDEINKLPQIVFIDGGKGQVSQAQNVFDELAITGVKLIGVAKGPDRKAGLETLILADSAKLINLPIDSPALHLIQHIRDESHRFAITAHRNKRHKLRFESGLEAIEGIGAKRRQALLKRFGGRADLAVASVEEIAKVKGISLALAQKIYDHFRMGSD
jgi:excinuclease ABC subunit C